MTGADEPPDEEREDETLDKLRGLLSHPDAAVRGQAIQLIQTLGLTSEFVRVDAGRLIPPTSGMTVGALELALHAFPGTVEEIPAVAVHEEATLEALGEGAPNLRRARIYWSGPAHDAEPLGALSSLEHLALHGVTEASWLPRLRALRRLEIESNAALPETRAALTHLTVHQAQSELIAGAALTLRSLTLRGHADATTVGRLAYLSHLELPGRHLKAARHGHRYPSLTIHGLGDHVEQVPIHGARVTVRRCAPTPHVLALKPRWVECEADAFPEFAHAGVRVVDLDPHAAVPDTVELPEDTLPGPRLMRLAARSRVILANEAEHAGRWVARGHRHQVRVSSPPIVPLANGTLGADPFVDPLGRVARDVIVCLTKPQAERLQLILNRAGAMTTLERWTP